MSKESTKPDSIRRIEGLKRVLLKRSLLISSIRSFLMERRFLELETPLLLDSPLPEPHIEAISAENGFLRTSHEPLLKACLAAGYDRIFEIGPCFRQEEKGRLHREEFTMLEWYQAGASSADLIPFTKDLLVRAAETTTGSTVIKHGGTSIDLDGEWEIIPLKKAFAEFAGADMADSVGKNRFEMDLVDRIEPALPKDRPCVLTGYPAEFRAYANLSASDPSVADRWELYIAGIEIANTYSELDDIPEIRRVMNDAAEKRASMGMKKYQECKIFEDAISAGIPRSAGCAMGIDRLMMILSDARSLDEVKI